MSGPPPRSPAEVIVGVDVGTTATKVVAFGIGSSWRAKAIREYPLLQPAPGWQVQDPAVITTAVVQALSEAVAAATTVGAHVVGISLSCAMHGLLALDDTMSTLTPVITWADARSREQTRALHRDGRAAALYRETGTPVHPMTPQSKLMWFSHHEPRLTAEARWWVGLKDYLLWHLTGQVVTELSSASGTGLLSLTTRQWSPAAVTLSGIRPEQLPPIAATTHVMPLASIAAARVGLPAGTPVIAGAADGPLGNLGTGAVEPGVAGLSLGTSGALRMAVPEPVIDDAGRLFCYALTDDQWVIGGAVSNGGIVARWAGTVFGTVWGDGITPDEDTLALADAVPPGSEGLIMLPYLLAERAPLWDPDLPGAYLGIRRHHTRGHFVRAAVEGVCLQLSGILGQLDRIQPVREVRATGGTFRSPLWRAVTAGMLNRPLFVTAGAEGTAVGAAALGLFALGRTASLAGAATTLAGEDSSVAVLVDPDHAAAYARVRARLPELVRAYQAVAELFDVPEAPQAVPSPVRQEPPPQHPTTPSRPLA
jgi:gluconokinase